MKTELIDIEKLQEIIINQAQESSVQKEQITTQEKEYKPNKLK
ncbi:MAG: hypothetical protein Q9M39_09870 [Sulfurovum sp.]|nr:hypothetical protein [Sulfurovum sp.]